MNKQELIAHLEDVDRELHGEATLYIYGSAACILLDEPDRTSIDVDVAAPYSRVDETDLRQAAEAAGLPVNPGDDYSGEHIEWIGPLRLCLQAPVAGTELPLWRGKHLRVQTAPIAGLIASKLIRYDDIDQSDIRYLVSLSHVPFSQIREAAAQLPPPFDREALVLENLDNLKTDMAMWGAS